MFAYKRAVPIFCASYYFECNSSAQCNISRGKEFLKSIFQTSVFYSPTLNTSYAYRREGIISDGVNECNYLVVKIRANSRRGDHFFFINILYRG